MKFFCILFLAVAMGVGRAQASSVCLGQDCVDVEVVTTTQDMKRGLQGKEHLGEKEGMLFVFKKDGFQKFWMKDMKISIDMIWLDFQGRIVTIAPGRLPCTQDPCEVYEPTAEARYVLEVPSGYAARHHLKPGDTLHFKDIH